MNSANSLQQRFSWLVVCALAILGCRFADLMTAGTPYPTPRGTRAPASVTGAATARANGTTTSTSSPSASGPTATLPAGLIPGPLLISPALGASFNLSDPIALEWSWARPLGGGEYFEIQIARDVPTNFTAVGCSIQMRVALTPQGPGSYLWRVVVRRGVASPPACVPQGEISQPSEARPFTVRAAATGTPTPAATAPSPTRAVTALPPAPTPTRKPYP